MEYNKQQNTVNGVPVGPLGLAYEYGTPQYTLAYYAFNLLWEHFEKHPTEVAGLAQQFGLPEYRIWELTEELFTNNADPDNEE